MIDTRGPVIRVANFKNGSVTLKKDTIVDITADSTQLGDEKSFCIKYKQLAKNVEIGQKIVMAGIHYGGVHLKVEKIFDESIQCSVKRSGVIYDGKRVYIRGSSMKHMPVVTQKDVSDIMFALEQGVEFLAISHVKSPKDIISIRKIVQLQGKNDVHIFAKIETHEALKCFKDILDVSDGIIIARGDLGMDIPIEQVTLVQKHITQLCNRMGKPVIIATQMLTSMIENTQPTRAEATDVANAVYDGADSVLLSKETSQGRHPILAVKTLVDILQEAELSVDYRKVFNQLS
eukprot:UN31850